LRREPPPNETLPMADGQISERVSRWREAWESRDIERIVAMYRPGAIHESSLIPRLYPEAEGTTVTAPESLREYVRRGLERFTELRFEIITATENDRRAAIEYRRHSNIDGANPAHVLELVEWDGDLISHVRVFHF
jgi:hypothetical protein